LADIETTDQTTWKYIPTVGSNPKLDVDKGTAAGLTLSNIDSWETTGGATDPAAITNQAASRGLAGCTEEWILDNYAV
jgi:hypothetical protein